MDIFKKLFRALCRASCIHNYRYIGYKFLRYKGSEPVVDAIYRCNKCGKIKKIKVVGKIGGK